MTEVARTTRERLRLIGESLNPGESVADPTAWVNSTSIRVGAAAAYLIVAVLTSRIPSSDEVLRAARDWRSDGLAALVDALVRRRRFGRLAPVRVSRGVVVDVTDTGRTPYTTGIQRVAREAVARWPRAEIEFVSWDRAQPVLRASSSAELRLVLGTDSDLRPAAEEGVVVVPFRGSYVLPEIAVARHRFQGVHSIAANSGSRMVAIGFDCIAVTTAEIAPPGMPAAFANYLSALARFDEVVAISPAAGDEFEGWRRMLGGAGLSGPRISVAELPFEVGVVTEPVVEGVRRELALHNDVPLVVAVGSHEPRKNHVTFLHACELLWQQGRTFAVVMAGGNSWDSDSFDELVAELKRRGRPLTTISRAADETIWSLYRLARFSVFCSLNEGFGLPVAESLASGTPVITSDFGSMRTLAEDNGGVIVDPRRPEAIAAAMAELLEDDAALARLRAASASLGSATWDDYAAAIWSVIGEPVR